VTAAGYTPPVAGSREAWGTGPPVNSPRNGRDYAGLVAVILAVTLGSVLLIAVLAEVFLDQTIGEGAQRLLTTIGAGLVGALSVYIGKSVGRKDKDGDGQG
jgi:hypothetical protein